MQAPFFIRFLLCSIVLTFLIAGILLIKKFLKNHISDKFQYYIGFIFLFILAVPFLPVQSLPLGQVSHWLDSFGQNQTLTNHLSVFKNTSLHPNKNVDWLQDFSVSASRAPSDWINYVILFIWLIGICIMLVLTYHSNRKIKQLKKLSALSLNPQLVCLFKQCKEALGIHKDINLYTSSLTAVPITFGFFHPCVVLPETIVADFSLKEIRYIFLHELQHYKRKDIFINYAMCLFHILYWFHPLVWYALKEMRTDREIACDAAVLRMLDETHYLEYGNTLINFADKYLHAFTLSCVSEMSGSKKQIKKRIIKIASFQAETTWTKFKSIAIFTLISFISLTSIPVLSFGAYEPQRFNFTNAQTKYEDLSAYFEGYQGSFVLYDLKADQYSIFNLAQSQKRIAPDSTFKIYSALFALEAGNITREHSMLTWDGTKQPYAAWNQNHDLSSAMKNSVNWYFQNLDKKLGMTELQSYYKKINYGNFDLSAGISNYWMESSLKISPIEQVELLKSFYTNAFQFKQESIQTVKDALFLSESNSAKLYGKTGTGAVNNKNANGWFIGYVEQNDNTYFFATNLQSEDTSTGRAAAKITLSILSDKNIYISTPSQTK